MTNIELLTNIFLIIGMVLSIPMWVRVGEKLSQKVRLFFFPIKKVKIRRWHNEQFLGYGELDLTSPKTLAEQLEQIDANLKEQHANGR